MKLAGRCFAIIASVAFGCWGLPAAAVAVTLDDGVAAYDAGDYDRAREIFEELAATGVAEAQYSLGVMAHAGVGRPQDDEVAVRRFRQAAEKDHLNSMFNLGIAYWEGAGTDQNVEEAVRWWRRAAELGLPEAQHNLGTVYYLGKGVPRDYALAIAWFRRAARNGHTEARTVLAKLSDKFPELTAEEEESRIGIKAPGQAPLPPAATTASEQSVAAIKPPQPAAIPAPDAGAERVDKRDVEESDSADIENADDATLLAYPSADAPGIGTIDVTTRLQVFDRKGDWVMVHAAKGVKVWVYGKYVDESNGQARITTNQVRARPLPSTGPDSEPVGAFDAGQQVTLVDRQGDWKRVHTLGPFAGWINAAEVAPAIRGLWNWGRIERGMSTIAGGATTGDDGRAPVYAFADPGAPVIGHVDTSAGLDVLQRQGEWMLVRVPDGVEVWVYGTYVDGDSGTGEVNSDQVRARPFPSTGEDSTPLGVFRKGDLVEIMDVAGKWKRVRTSNRVAGWIRSPN